MAAVSILLGIFIFPIPSLSKEIAPLDRYAWELKTPEQLENYMQTHFRYMSDQAQFGRQDYWQSPEEMLRRRRGDCEDYAVFAEAILKRNGYQTFLLGIYGPETAHTITVFQKGGERGFFDLGKAHFSRSDPLDLLPSSIPDSWSYLGIMRQEGSSGMISQKFERHFLANPVSLPFLLKRSRSFTEV